MGLGFAMQISQPVEVQIQVMCVSHGRRIRCPLTVHQTSWWATTAPIRSRTPKWTSWPTKFGRGGPAYRTLTQSRPYAGELVSVLTVAVIELAKPQPTPGTTVELLFQVPTTSLVLRPAPYRTISISFGRLFGYRTSKLARLP